MNNVYVEVESYEGDLYYVGSLQSFNLLKDSLEKGALEECESLEDIEVLLDEYNFLLSEVNSEEVDAIATIDADILSFKAY